MDKFAHLQHIGQSLWYDNIQRRLLRNGELAEMIARGEIRGVTSNPSIFNNAIARSNDYDAALKPMAWAGWNAEQIFFQLAVEDIRAATDLFSALYQESKRGDGYVSLEVSPTLAHNAKKTLEQAQALWGRVYRPNLMIKIPATRAGLKAVRGAIAAGLNINVTLIFSLERYAEVIDAYLSGLEDRAALKEPIDSIASVASFFVSRVDTKVDGLLQANIARGGAAAEKARVLLGKAAIANARLAYHIHEETVASERWTRLSAKGARPQRPLWASTSTKNPAYPDLIYVTNLIAPETVNTVPPQTLDAFRDHGTASLAFLGEAGLAEARAVISGLESLGISMARVTAELEEEGVKAFADAFAVMLQAIEIRRKAAQAELGSLAKATATRVAELWRIGTPERLFAQDPTLWTEDPAAQEEIRKRMDWLNLPMASRALIPDMAGLMAGCQMEGFTHALLLGMGGSSMAPEVFDYTFGQREMDGAVGLELTVLDSTDPGQVRAAARSAPLDSTLYIVSSKSGTTSEINAFLDYFWARAKRRFGKQAGRYFVAITDPGTPLEKIAKERDFRQVFQADAGVGGRNSALSAFGLVPATLLGIESAKLLDRAQAMMEECGPEMPAARNPGLVLGAILGQAALEGRDKLTLLTEPAWGAFGAWLEQLVAESSGKQGKGILPVDNEPLARPGRYGKDRIFVYLRQNGDMDLFVAKLRRAKQPVLILDVKDEYDLAAEFYRWEVATAVACAVLGVNSFDQPDVQDNKNRTARKVKDYAQTGKLEEGEPLHTLDGALIYGVEFPGVKQAKTLRELVGKFLKQVKTGDYVAINAYVPRNSTNFARLQKLRKGVGQRTRAATTLGFGPRFLHSTGQLHKGGPDTGVFLQITADPGTDIDIPGQGMSFGVLERAQALGDLEALMARGRRVIRVHLKGAKIADML
jgi:transaldolase/glucose-6-phosphate isomerase